jgi:hypothetical protein
LGIAEEQPKKAVEDRNSDIDSPSINRVDRKTSKSEKLFQEDKAIRIKEVRSYSDFIAIKDRWKDALVAFDLVETLWE